MHLASPTVTKFFLSIYKFVCIYLEDSSRYLFSDTFFPLRCLVATDSTRPVLLARLDGVDGPGDGGDETDDNRDNGCGAISSMTSKTDGAGGFM